MFFFLSTRYFFWIYLSGVVVIPAKFLYYWITEHWSWLNFIKIFLTVDCNGCKADFCSSQYTEALDREKIDRPEPTVTSCNILRDFGRCLKFTAKECHGNIPYHTSIVMVKQLSKENNCVALIGPDKTQSVPTLLRPSVIPKLPNNNLPVSTVAPRSCAFHGRNKFRYCGLFGDPHLKTFNSKYQTCKLKGAWPLIDNPYLAVSVTNELIIQNSPATVMTKVSLRFQESIIH